VIGHLKADHRMGRNYPAGQAGDATNAVLTAVGYNFRLLLVWLAGLGWLLHTLVRSASTDAHYARCVT
jgi:IS5 family transposase